jgi:hypothetical protein
MTNPLKASFAIVAVLASGVCIYDRWQLMKAPTAHVSASSLPARTTATAPSGPGHSTVPAMSDVDHVKNGTLPEYKNLTLGEAFERRFQDPVWKAAFNLQGQRVVTLHGSVKYTVLREAGFYIGTWNGVAQGIEAEDQILAQRHRCFGEAGQTETVSSDDTMIGPCMAKGYQSIVIPVSFEFALSPDKKIVEMTSADSVFQKFDSDHRLRRETKATLAFIYQ